MLNDDRGKTPIAQRPPPCGGRSRVAIRDEERRGDDPACIGPSPIRGKPRQAAQFRRRDALVRSRPNPHPDDAEREHLRQLREEMDRPDVRCAGSAFDVFGAEGNTQPIISAASGFAVLVLRFSANNAMKVIGFSAHPVIGWQSCHDGRSLMPVCFNLAVPFHQMCDMAVRNPDGSINSFEGCSFPNAQRWLADRKRVLKQTSRKSTKVACRR